MNLGFMFLPKYRAWVIVASLVVCLATWYAIERTKLGAYLRAATENRAAGPRRWASTCRGMITLHLRLRRRPRRARRGDGGTDLSGQPADGRRPHHRRLRGRGDRRMGSILGAILTGFGSASSRPDQGVLPGGVEHVIFVIM